MLKNPIEGCFIITLDDLIFEVKGIIHPRDRIIAYIRYVPDAKSERRGYRKIYSLSEREDYLKAEFSQYLWYSKVHGRILQSVPQERIKSVLNPVEYLIQMRKNSSKNSELGKSTVRLSNKLMKIADIKETDIGVTGSQLAEVTTEASDIDLVIYGDKPCLELYEGMKESFDQTPDFIRYSGNLLDAHVTFRWEKLKEYHDILRLIERKKILQGVFESYQFFIRLVKLPSDLDQQYGTIVTKMRDICEIECKVSDNSNSIFTPCEYLVQSDEYPELRKLISYRGRFTEQVSSNDLVRVRGRLEDVIDTRTDEKYQQMVLGEDPLDYLIPI